MLFFSKRLIEKTSLLEEINKKSVYKYNEKS
jgi:hypothetical protein